MKFSIITPSFRNSKWLKLCIASVADQQGVELEHIVQDAGSDDGTLDWLPCDPRVKAFVEKDSGMYDAINRGFRRASGDILAYLNCDEQYLPGALTAVHDYFENHPEVDVLMADTVVVDAEGNYVCHRHGLTSWQYTSYVRVCALTCSIFLRKRVLDKHGLYFDTRWRTAGDAVWLIEMAKRGLRFGSARILTSAFTETGDNLALSPRATEEHKARLEMVPAWVLRFKQILVMINGLRIMASGGYFRKPFNYSIYTLGCPDQRQKFRVDKPSHTWRRPA